MSRAMDAFIDTLIDRMVSQEPFAKKRSVDFSRARRFLFQDQASRPRMSIHEIQRLNDGVIDIDPSEIELVEIELEHTVELKPGVFCTFSVAHPANGKMVDDVSDVRDFSADFLFLYRYENSVSPGGGFTIRESFVDMLREHPVVFVLYLQPKMPVPFDWICTLKTLKEEYGARFDYVCADSSGSPSFGAIYGNGVFYNSLQLTHTRHLISHGRVIRGKIDECFQKLPVDGVRSSVALSAHNVLGTSPSILINIPDFGAGHGDLSSLPRASERTIDGWMSSGRPISGGHAKK